MGRLTSSILEKDVPLRRNRTTPDGCIRLDRKLYKIGVGRIQISSGTTDPKQAVYRNALITKCVEESWLDILVALRDGEISIQELEAAQKKGRLKHALEDARGRRARPTSLLARTEDSRCSPSSTCSSEDALVVRTAPVATERATSLAAAIAAGLNPAFAMQQSLANVTWPEESRPLWNTLRTRMVPLCGGGSDTHRRYATSLDSFRNRLPEFAPSAEVRAGLELLKLRDENSDEAGFNYADDAIQKFHHLAGEDATIGDLKLIRREYWDALEKWWGRSAADWNHLRRALSATLTTLFKFPEHPFRQQVIHAIPARAEGGGRVPNLSPRKFWEVVDAMPEHARPGVVVLVATGMRLKEYEHTTEAHLKQNIFGVDVPGAKTAESTNTIFVAPDIWPWVEAGIPAPLKRRRLWVYWKAACESVGVHDVTLHDLRHCLGQWSTDEGCDERDVQWALRHTDPNMTRRYTRVRGRRNVARAAGKVLTRARRRGAK